MEPLDILVIPKLTLVLVVVLVCQAASHVADIPPETAVFYKALLDIEQR